MDQINQSTKLTYQIISVSLSLTVIGLFLLYSIKPEFFFNQLPAVGLGIGLMIGLSLVPFNKLLSWSWLIVVVNLGLLVLVFFSPAIRGAHRWLNFFNFHIQPSELFKFSLVLFSWRMVYEIFLPQSTQTKTSQPPTFKLGFISITYLVLSHLRANFKLVTLIMVFGFGLGLVLIEPDLGTFLFLALSLSLAWLAVFFNFKRLLLIGLALILLIPFAWYQLKPYQQQRLIAFTDPYLDPQKSGYNIIQAQLTLRNGGWWGQIEPSSQYQKSLPESHTDFIFAVWVEETGFVGGLGLLSLYLLFIYFIHQAKNLLAPPESIPIILIIFFLAVQAFIHIAINLSLLPVTGLTLPFISYGRSSILANFAILGLFLSRLNGKNHYFLKSQILNQQISMNKLKAKLTEGEASLKRSI